MLYFVFGVVVNAMAQKNINLSELNIVQLNLYMKKAVDMRNAGMVLTFAGTGGVIIGIILGNNLNDNTLQEDLEQVSKVALIETGSIILGGTGISLWIIGSKRKSNSVIALKKFDIKTDNSMAVGLGLTIRF